MIKDLTTNTACEKWMPLRYSTPLQILEFKVLVRIEAEASTPTEAELKQVVDKTIALDRQYPLPMGYLVN